MMNEVTVYISGPISKVISWNISHCLERFLLKLHLEVSEEDENLKLRSTG